MAEGWIKDPSEIPDSAVPVNPHRLNLGGSWSRPTFFQNVDFTCRDCGVIQIWLAEDQAWYYESFGAPYYSSAIRCRSCRLAERERKAKARQNAGHE
ncbi:MAG: zinc-ribbon domain containing protein [Roseibacillus sp.]